MINLPRIARRRSSISGWGVYAAQPIKKDTRIVEYKGQLVSQTEAARRERRYLPRRRIWLFDINTRWARDAAFGGNIARYINHACRPNCYIEVTGHHIWVIASRDVRKGEELTYDYNTDGEAGIPCRCRQRCRGVI
ncbi:MAG: SET domain-containing protein-lysine N-methyltransferase [Anaerolineae bacterium]|nr:SET domain-containing protein-lysine N-methyltransferase [Phycisphaerae bacterium]